MTDASEPMSGQIGDPAEVRKQFWKAFSDHPTVMISLMNGSQHSEPMMCQVDKDASDRSGQVWIFTSTDNRIAVGGKAMAQYVAKGHDLWACINGTLTRETDEAIIDKFWSNPIEAWYAEGRQDPKLLVLRFDMGDAEIWAPDLTVKGMFKMMTGMTMKAGDMGDHAEVKL